MKLAIFNQNCRNAGKRALTVEENLEWDDGDVTIYEGSDSELRKVANCYLDQKAVNSNILFTHKVADTILAALAE